MSPACLQIGQRLERYGRFGVELGLERIQRLLDALGQPQRQVPIVHVAGTNGKGSVCAYLGSVLSQAGYRVGVYTSPHLVSWCDRITLNQQPIAPGKLLHVLDEVEAAIDPAQPMPTQFEVFTAAMWLYFAQAQVDLAVIEVGLGGRLDATNVCDRPLVTVITSLSLEHWQRLGPTLAHIAYEKAGVLKPGCPAVIGPLPGDAEQVVSQRLVAVGCPSFWPAPARDLGKQAEYSGGIAYSSTGASLPFPTDLMGLRYPLPLLGPHQRTNSALAIAALACLRAQGWQVSVDAITQGMAQTRWPGRLEWVRWQGQPLLVDGAHNPAAAEALRQYVDGLVRGEEPGVRGEATDPSNLGLSNHLPLSLPPLPTPSLSTTTWLMGMLATKDHADIFKALLRPGDRLHLVPVPGHDSADPGELRAIAQSVCPDLDCCNVHRDLFEALAASLDAASGLTVLCGSLYLIGDFLATAGPGLQRGTPTA